MPSQPTVVVTDTDILFDSFDLDGLTLDNRVGLAPMTRTSATDDGHATEQMARYYASFARGDFGFLVTEGTHPDTEYSQGYPNQPGLATDAQADAWTQVTDAVHDAGAPIFAQLMHAGALSQGNRYTEETAGPSVVTPKGEQLPIYGGEGAFPTPKRMTTEEIDDAIEGFAAAAERAVDAGFDGVEVHGANGYLLDQFLTDYTNERDDEYGGSVENRIRLTTEVIEAVQARTPDEFVVGVRLSQTKVNDDEHEWGEGEQQAEVVFEAVSDAGADYVHVTEPDVTAPAFGETGPTLAAYAAEYADAPVIANGNLGDPDAAVDAIEEDDADLVAQGTAALANHDWPARVRDDDSLDAFSFEDRLLPDATLDDDEAADDIVVPADD
ncbi:NADH:flavin oxidoreductase [Halobacterium zhouii]|uniref:NADH:flavin oxidoreductase n=1 Tax=Halobacterium zhouii TaxID=2902624 RepID=UPI001E5AB210|nr:NADH:flavin oxidoreductase [Halobacterium zhouii]